MKKLQVDPVATARHHLSTAKAELDARTTAMNAFGWERWPGGRFVTAVDSAAEALQDPGCRGLVAEIAQIGEFGRPAAVDLVLRFQHLPTLADCGGDEVLRAYLGDGSHIHADIADVDPALSVRLTEIVDDPGWSVVLRMTAKYAALGGPQFSIAPVSLSDDHIRTALVGNINWRRVQPASVDKITDDSGAEVAS